MIVCKLFVVFQHKSSHWVLLNFLSQKSPNAVILGVVEPILFLSFYTCSNDETSNTRMERGSGPRIWLFIHHHPFKRFLEVHHLWMRHGVIEIQMFSLFSPDRWFSDAIGIVLICCCSIVAKPFDALRLTAYCFQGHRWPGNFAVVGESGVPLAWLKHL